MNSRINEMAYCMNVCCNTSVEPRKISSTPWKQYRFTPFHIRFWCFIKPLVNGCWEWTGTVNNQYGMFSVGSKFKLTHRLAYEMLNGPIPDGLEIDHLCRNKLCANPDHLEAVTHTENMVRMHRYRGHGGEENG